ncbi:MAG: diguanylate cyclase response regulator [Sulfurimonas sp.]|nr:MAG: diguanylate cyclase response regulator [Sulfurimonas sp.]
MQENYTPTVLIVDDVPANIAILSDLLKENYKIKVANNGQRALELARAKEKPDLILLDIEMPLMGGYDVCKKLKESSDTKDIHIIFVTAKDGLSDEEHGLKLGAIDYIKKPFHPAIIKIRVKNHITLKLKSDKLEEISMCDSITGISNRRFFDEAFEKKYKETSREKKNLGVIMIDIDYFKFYNDNYGHWKGDECLVKVARAIKRTIKRPSDIASRYGGEEFVVLLKDIDKEGVKKVAEALVHAVANLKIEHEHSLASKYVTISAGVALKETEEISMQELLKKADDELYRAKESGRNRFCAEF